MHLLLLTEWLSEELLLTLNSYLLSVWGREQKEITGTVSQSLTGRKGKTKEKQEAVFWEQCFLFPHPSLFLWVWVECIVRMHKSPHACECITTALVGHCVFTVQHSNTDSFIRLRNNFTLLFKESPNTVIRVRNTDRSPAVSCDDLDSHTDMSCKACTVIDDQWTGDNYHTYPGCALNQPHPQSEKHDLIWSNSENYQ